MYSENFKASVQFGDWKGTSAADNSDSREMARWLEESGHKKDGEFLIGVELYADNRVGPNNEPVSINFLFVELDGFENVQAKFDSTNEPPQLKRVRVDMKLSEFFTFFKRFSISFSSHGLLDNVVYSPIDTQQE